MVAFVYDTSQNNRVVKRIRDRGESSGHTASGREKSHLVAGAELEIIEPRKLQSAVESREPFYLQEIVICQT